ncbi:MAG TPA: PLP-dependent aminotransferase family protein [Candidatus Acidoferrum sp.]|nr:PLP-dependent aminotransferase family protein [Candidatus Acidoferrum sp.]
MSETGQPVYMAIVKAISDDIARGTLSKETRLPTHRELADSLRVAIGTVTRAYAEAERRGLIRSEGRRGTFVGEQRSSRSVLSSIAGLPPLGIDLSKNHPSYLLDPDLPSALKEIARNRSAASLLEYSPAAGQMRHRECGARWLSMLGAIAAPESVFVTAGAQHAVSVILASETKRGDVIATERFTYTGVKALAEILDLHLIGLPADEYGLIPEALDSLCRKRRVRVLYCNPSLQNPTNTIWPKERREQIAALAIKYGITIIEDEIMRPLLVEHPGFMTSMAPEQCYLVVSTSKAVAAGLRVGFILASAKAGRALIDSLNASSLGTPPLMAELFSVWLDDGTVDRVIERRREDASQRQALAAGVLNGLRFHGNPSSYNIWLEMPEGWTSMKLAMEAQLRGAVVAPGEAFAVDSKLPYEAVRLSVVSAPTRELLKTGLSTIAGVLKGSSRDNIATV